VTPPRGAVIAAGMWGVEVGPEGERAVERPSRIEAPRPGSKKDKARHRREQRRRKRRED
jgi:hypothetical protein